jgi:hypothetical protein
MLPSDGKMKINPQLDLAEGVYDEGYGPLAERWLRHERKVLFYKQGAGKLGPFFLVVDRLYPADATPRQVQLLWHLGGDSVKTAEGAAFTADAGLPNLSVVPARQVGLALTVVRGQEAPEFQGWMAIKNHQQGEYAPIPTLVYEREISAPTRLVTLLYPTRPGEACLVKAVLASTNVTDLDILLSLGDCEALELVEAE